MKSEDYVSQYLKLIDCNIKITKYEGTNKIRSLKAYNLKGQLEAPHDFPSEIEFTQKGYPVMMFWHQSGNLGRKNDLPANIGFHPNSEEPFHLSWYINDLEDREGDMPSTMHFEKTTGRVTLIEFTREGDQYRSEGRHPYIGFNEDGTMQDEEGTPIFVDKEDLPDRLFVKPESPKFIIPSIRDGFSNNITKPPQI